MPESTDIPSSTTSTAASKLSGCSLKIVEENVCKRYPACCSEHWGASCVAAAQGLGVGVCSDYFGGVFRWNPTPWKNPLGEGCEMYAPGAVRSAIKLYS